MNFVATDPFAALADDPKHWILFTGTATIDKQRARLWIKEDNLITSPKLRAAPLEDETTFIRAYLGLHVGNEAWGPPHFFVRVTCTVRGDRRVRYRPGQGSAVMLRDRAGIIDTGFERFRERNRRGQNSALNVQGADPDMAYEFAFAQSRLNAFGERTRGLLDRQTVAGSWEAPYIKTDFRLGDAYRGVSGLGINFPQWPTCTAIEWQKDAQAGYRTVYHLTDLRHAPESGAE